MRYRSRPAHPWPSCSAGGPELAAEVSLPSCHPKFSRVVFTLYALFSVGFYDPALTNSTEQHWKGRKMARGWKRSAMLAASFAALLSLGAQGTSNAAPSGSNTGGPSGFGGHQAPGTGPRTASWVTG